MALALSVRRFKIPEKSGISCEDCGEELPEKCIEWIQVTAASWRYPAEYEPAMAKICPHCEYWGRVYG